ncbi:hypothetical protein [Paludisphaera rhizosphaerae]|uniref:hypothetical protein n=1 Tax=Paludisphaera rhizosphaerae TaxID=2711216 RepID=UPI0013EC4565|nr:hypothetical protein [Paludisphaera rhizosphaerae]
MVERALEAAAWVEPESPEEEVTGEDPAGAAYFVSRMGEGGSWKRYAVNDRTDPEYLASQKRYEWIVEEVEKGKPWFDPMDGLRTVRGLIEMAEKGIPLAWREEAADRLRSRLIEAGMEPGDAKEMYPRPVGDYPFPLWDLRTFEMELEFAVQIEDLFHFTISY